MHFILATRFPSAKSFLPLFLSLSLLKCLCVEALPSILEPVKGATLEDEIKCYSIPYGGIGFASHILTYYALVCMWYGSRPLLPWLRLKYGIWDCILGVITLIASDALSIFTIIRCQNRWQFITIAVWKLCLSSTFGLTAISASILSHREKPPEREVMAKSRAWMIIYIVGLIVGMVGLVALVVEVWPTNMDVRYITYVFGGTCSAAILLITISFWIRSACDHDDDDMGTVCMVAPAVTAAFAVVVLGVFYSDWILGAVANNLAGFPSSDIMLLYWTYFVAKKVPFALM